MGPKYTSPCVEIPCTWRLEVDESSTLANVRWWEQFDDSILDELIITALKNNQDLRVAISRVWEFYARLGISNSNLYPTVDGVVRYDRSRNFNSPVSNVPGFPIIFNDYQVYFAATWEVDLWGRLRSAAMASYADLLGQIEARRVVVMTVVTNVANAYITLRALDYQLDISRKTLRTRKEALQLAIDRFRLGETSELEVKQAESEVEVAAIRVIQFERDIPKQENLLSVLIGESPHDIIRGRSIDQFEYPINIPSGLPSDLLTRRPDIVEAEDNLISANAHVWEERARYFPTITLTGDWGSQSIFLEDLFKTTTQSWSWGVTIIQNLFDAGRRGYQVEAAEAFRAEELYTYRQTILNAFREVNDALIDVKKNRELYYENKRQVKTLGEYLKLAQLRYNEGEIDYLNVLDAERSLFDAELQMIQSQAESFTAVVSLYNALGGGWVCDADAIATNCD